MAMRTSMLGLPFWESAVKSPIYGALVQSEYSPPSLPGDNNVSSSQRGDKFEASKRGRGYR